MDKQAALKAAMSIPDERVTAEDVSHLYDLARDAHGPIVEIGGGSGRSTAILALGAKVGGRQVEVYSLTDEAEEVRQAMSAIGVNGQVTVNNLFSTPFPSEVDNVDMVYAHGAHGNPSTWEGICGSASAEGRLVFHHADHLTMIARADKQNWVPDGELGKTPLQVFGRRVCKSPRSVMLATPGKMLNWPTVLSVLTLADGFHHVQTTNSGNGWDDFNAVWCRALNAVLAGEITHFVQLHSDIAPDGHWLDMLIDEMERGGFDMVSAVAPIKDTRGVTSSGVGDAENRWEPYRRFTVRELMDLPITFTAEDIGYGDRFLLHNTGCFVCDLRNPMFFEIDQDSAAEICFNFPTHVRKMENGQFVNFRESEDWYFSRKLHELGGRSAITRRVRLLHRGVMDFNNFEPWGAYEQGDEDTAYKWRKVGLA